MVELVEQVGPGSFSDLGFAAGYENNLALKGTFGFGPSFQLGFFGEKIQTTKHTKVHESPDLRTKPRSHSVRTVFPSNCFPFVRFRVFRG